MWNFHDLFEKFSLSKEQAGDFTEFNCTFVLCVFGFVFPVH